MAHEEKRRPGTPNPGTGNMHNPDLVAGGRGNDYGIARGIFAMLDWRKRRRAIKARRP